jgi:Tannase and feruloyl esterase
MLDSRALLAARPATLIAAPCRKSKWACAVAIAAAALFIYAPLVQAQALGSAPASQTECHRLTALASSSLTISAAQWVGAGPLPSGAARMIPFLSPVPFPAHCLVRGVLDPRTGLDGVKYGLGFELRMPANWNGRFLFQGGGGLDGAVMPAVGLVSIGAPLALSSGFAVISSDGGHEGRTAAFAADQQARLDYAYAGLGPVAELGQRLVASYYGKPARDSYFAGCSNGGREAMMIAERFPGLFNGIVAGDPGFNLSAAGVAEMWNVKHLSAIAPKDSHGAPILSEALTDEDLKLVSNAVLQVCDAQDGLRDGMINDIAACHFDPKQLLCRPGSSSHCLSEPKVHALEAIFGGPHDSSGRALYASWPFDAGIDSPGWRVWKLGTSPTGVPNAADATLGVEAMSSYFMTPPDPAMTPATFDFDKARQVTAQTAAINDATGTFFSSYIARGGKLIIYQGMSDPVFSPNAIIAWYQELMSQNRQSAQWARLFLVPGMNHCAGGPATDQFDALTAIVKWTEDGKPPARISAHGAAFPGMTRPLCPYPKYARYRGGSPADERSFVCVDHP